MRFWDTVSLTHNCSPHLAFYRLDEAFTSTRCRFRPSPCLQMRENVCIMLKNCDVRDILYIEFL